MAEAAAQATTTKKSVMKQKKLVPLVAGALLAAAGGSAAALDLKPDGIAVHGSIGTNTARMAGVGLIWDWEWEVLRRKAAITGQTEWMINRWQADDFGGGHQGFTQVVLLPTVRFELSQGRSPWFAELGVGVSYLDRHYLTPHRDFGSRWNFYDVIGVGHTFGAQRTHELTLRWVHVSNLGIREPNPGQDFVQVRYARRFCRAPPARAFLRPWSRTSDRCQAASLQTGITRTRRRAGRSQH